MKIAVYGASGFAREVAPIAGADLFVSDDPSEYGPSVLSLERLPPEYLITIAISDSQARRRVANRCSAAGRSFADVVAPTSVRRGRSEIGEGAILCDFTVITDNVRIGRHFHANIYSYVAHDCVVGDFVTLAPRVCINGNTVIEDDVYIGSGAVLKQGTPDKPLQIGRGAVIGMGAVVTKDVPPGAVMVGNPARPLERPQPAFARA